MISATGNCWPSSWPRRNGVIGSRGPRLNSCQALWSTSTSPSPTVLVPTIFSLLPPGQIPSLLFPAELLSWHGGLKSNWGQPQRVNQDLVLASQIIYLSGVIHWAHTESEGLETFFSSGFGGQGNLWTPVLTTTSTNHPFKLLLVSYNHSIPLQSNISLDFSMACPHLMATEPSSPWWTASVRWPTLCLCQSSLLQRKLPDWFSSTSSGFMVSWLMWYWTEDPSLSQSSGRSSVSSWGL